MRFKPFRALGAALALAGLLAGAALAAQFDYGTINPATKTGSQLASDLNNRAAAENSGHAGTSRPAYAAAGLIWSNTSFSPPHPTLYDGTNDVDLTDLFAPSPGTIQLTARVTLESGWLWCDGSAKSRTTYDDLFNAITLATTGDTTSSSATVATIPSDLRNLGLDGAAIEGSGIPAGTTVVSLTATTITLSQPATATATGVSLRILPFGAGNGSTTFNLPDARGRVIAGRDDMGGTWANRLTTAGAGIDGDSLGVGAGAQTQTLTVAQLPAHSHTASSSGTTSSAGAHDHGGATGADGNHTHSGTTLKGRGTGQNNHGHVNPDTNRVATEPDSGNTNTLTSTVFNWAAAGNHTHTIASDGTHTHTLSLTTTIGNTGSGSPHPIVQPTLIGNCIIRY